MHVETLQFELNPSNFFILSEATGAYICKSAHSAHVVGRVTKNNGVLAMEQKLFHTGIGPKFRSENRDRYRQIHLAARREKKKHRPTTTLLIKTLIAA